MYYLENTSLSTGHLSLEMMKTMTLDSRKTSGNNDSRWKNWETLRLCCFQSEWIKWLFTIDLYFAVCAALPATHEYFSAAADNRICDSSPHYKLQHSGIWRRNHLNNYSSGWMAAAWKGQQQTTANSPQSGIWGKIIAPWLNCILGHLSHSNEMAVVVTRPFSTPWRFFLPDYRAGTRGDYLPTGRHLIYVHRFVLSM